MYWGRKRGQAGWRNGSLTVTIVCQCAYSHSTSLFSRLELCYNKSSSTSFPLRYQRLFCCHIRLFTHSYSVAVMLVYHDVPFVRRGNGVNPTQTKTYGTYLHLKRWIQILKIDGPGQWGTRICVALPCSPFILFLLGFNLIFDASFSTRAGDISSARFSSVLAHWSRYGLRDSIMEVFA